MTIACDLSEIDNSKAIQFFTVNTTSIAPNGSITLSWKVTGADEIFIDNGIGAVPSEGTEEITFEEHGLYTYTLTAVASGSRETESITISCAESIQSISSRIIDHTCTDPSLLPGYAAELAKDRILFQYSRYGIHGDQILIGLDELEALNPVFASAITECRFPSEPATLRIMNGFWAQAGVWPCTNYISPEDFWGEGLYGLMWYFYNYFFDRKPFFNTTIWMWEDISGYSHIKINDYAQMLYITDFFINFIVHMMFPALEYPNLNIVVSTAPADTPNARRYERNKEIRKWAGRFGFWLLDIEDIECWYNGEQHLVDGIPTRHPHYDDDGSGGGTNADLRIAKATAFWWLSAAIAGWDGN